jgi:hypothetical protein
VTCVLLLPALALAVDLPPLQRATQCYAQADLLCVVQVLEHTTLSGPELAEGTRLLAFTYARLDRHAEARQAFTRWITQDPQHKLDRATTPPAVFTDYTAALLQAHEAELDLEPHLELQAVLPAPAVTPSDLPRFAPPPPSSRDKASDFAVLAGANVHLPSGNVALQMALLFDVGRRAHVGLELGAFRTVDDRGLANTADLKAYLQYVYATLGPGWTVVGDRRHGLDLDVGVFFAFSDAAATGTLPGISGALRYHLTPGSAPIGLFVQTEALFSPVLAPVLLGSIGIQLGRRPST